MNSQKRKGNRWVVARDRPFFAWAEKKFILAGDIVQW
jgi:hypothetical protein